MINHKIWHCKAIALTSFLRRFINVQQISSTKLKLFTWNEKINVFNLREESPLFFLTIALLSKKTIIALLLRCSSFWDDWTFVNAEEKRKKNWIWEEKLLFIIEIHFKNKWMTRWRRMNENESFMKIHKWRKKSQIKKNSQMRKKIHRWKALHKWNKKENKKKNHFCTSLKRNRRVVEAHNWILKMKLQKKKAVIMSQR